MKSLISFVFIVSTYSGIFAQSRKEINQKLSEIAYQLTHYDWPEISPYFNNKHKRVMLSRNFKLQGESNIDSSMVYQNYVTATLGMRQSEFESVKTGERMLNFSDIEDLGTIKKVEFGKIQLDSQTKTFYRILFKAYLKNGRIALGKIRLEKKSLKITGTFS